jgi:antitoxin component of RelBE/YafQ-DinJ toxin-antitoxin module
MDTRIQFRVDEEVKKLAQQMAESQGRTISDACRELTEQLAEAQRKAMSHELWLTTQVNDAFEKLESGESSFIANSDTKKRMAERKAKIRLKGRLLIIPEISMLVSYFVDGSIIRVMRALHQKQKFPQ